MHGIWVMNGIYLQTELNSEMFIDYHGLPRAAVTSIFTAGQTAAQNVLLRF